MAIFFPGLTIDGGQANLMDAEYRVLAPTTQDNLTIFPIVTGWSRDTHEFLTLDEGLRSGEVVVTEEGRAAGLVRPRTQSGGGVYREGRYPGGSGAEVNRLVLINNSKRPLILLAGEIVTGGKQDRVVSKDRIIPALSEPIDLGVFCVEPHRWEETSAHFGSLGVAMAQPSVRSKAMAAKDQQQVWNGVAQSKARMAAAVPAPAARALASTSSYAVTVQNGAVRAKVDAVALPLERLYEQLMHELQAQKAVGAVVAVNGEIVWVDAFASSALLEKYWPKLVRSYAAEAIAAGPGNNPKRTPSVADAQAFLDDFHATRESVESQPGIYRNTELMGPVYDAFILTSLLPGTGFNLHVAKMKLDSDMSTESRWRSLRR
jgi:hypothetical protein